MLVPLWLPLLRMYVMEKETSKKRLTESRLEGLQHVVLLLEESRVVLTDGEKNLIYKANNANPLTVKVIFKTFKNLTNVIFVREKPQHLLICDSLGIGRFYLSSSKTSHLVLKDIGRPFKAALVSERKQVWITDCDCCHFQSGGGQDKDHRAQI